MNTTRICKECKQEKPLLEFQTKRGSKTESRRTCHDCWREIIRGYNAAERYEALVRYSRDPVPACECCGEQRVEFLAIDHTEGEGNKHRNTYTGRIVSWLRENGWPAGFRVLCHNCNQARGAYGYCPHDEPTRFHDLLNAHQRRREANPKAFRRLTEQEAREVKRRLAEGEKGIRLAREYNVSTQAISSIKNGRAWKNL